MPVRIYVTHKILETEVNSLWIIFRPTIQTEQNIKQMFLCTAVVSEFF